MAIDCPAHSAQRCLTLPHWLTKERALFSNHVSFLTDMGASITAVQALRTAAHDAVYLRKHGLVGLPIYPAKGRESCQLKVREVNYLVS